MSQVKGIDFFFFFFLLLPFPVSKRRFRAYTFLGPPWLHLRIASLKFETSREDKHHRMEPRATRYTGGASFFEFLLFPRVDKFGNFPIFQFVPVRRTLHSYGIIICIPRFQLPDKGQSRTPISTTLSTRHRAITDNSRIVPETYPKKFTQHTPRVRQQTRKGFAPITRVLSIKKNLKHCPFLRARGNTKRRFKTLKIYFSKTEKDPKLDYPSLSRFTSGRLLRVKKNE